MRNKKQQNGRRIKRLTVNQGVTTGNRVPRSNFLSTSIAGVPQSTRQTLSWSALGQGATGTVTFTDLQMIRLNSPYDPDVALGGTSTTGFARLMQMYTKCFVLGARIKVKVVNTNATGDSPPTSPIIIGITLSTNASSLGSVQQAISTGLSQHVLLGFSPDVHTFNLGCDISKFVDKPDILDDPDFATLATSNPNQSVVSHLWCYQLSALSKYVAWVVELEQDCVFTDPQPFS